MKIRRFYRLPFLVMLTVTALTAAKTETVISAEVSDAAAHTITVDLRRGDQAPGPQRIYINPKVFGINNS